MAVSQSNFFKDHYDWLVALVGIVLLAGVGYLYFASAEENTPEAARMACETELKGANSPTYKKVPPADENISFLKAVEDGFKKPAALDVVSDVEESFLASESRVFCQNPDTANRCHRPIPFKSEKCPFCGFQQPSENPEEVERKGFDKDGDGMPDAWETRYGLNPDDRTDADKDADGDLFSNQEEFQAKTNPKDPEDHPDYLDFLTLAGSLDTKTLPFWISDVTPMAGGNYRVWFNATDPKYDGKKVSAVKGEEIAFMPKGAKWNAKPENSGWRVVKIEKKSKQVKRRGAGQETSEDFFIVDLERVSDKTVKSVPWKERDFPIEEQIDLRWDRGEGKTFTVAKGTVFELNKRKYKVEKLRKDRVTIVDLKTEKPRTIGNNASDSNPAASPSTASKPNSVPSPTQQGKKKP